MADERFERDLRTMLARDLDPIQGPHARWAEAPVGRRIDAARGAARPWPVFVALAAAALAVIAIVAIFASGQSRVPVATAAPSASAPLGTSPGCPTLADYWAAAASPSSEPPSPSFAPVADNAPASSGVLAPGQVGIIAAPDGSPGALVRVSNPRLCDRLPDDRPEAFESTRSLPGDYRLLLVDVDLKVLKSGSIDRGFIPGTSVVWAKSRQYAALPDPQPYNFPGANPSSTIATGAGFAYRGTMSWVVQGAGQGGRIAVEVGPQDGPVHFEYLIQDGSTDRLAPRPLGTVPPGASPSTGRQALDGWTVVSADRGLIPVYVGGVAVVDGYPKLQPSRPGDKFLEVFERFGVPSAVVTINPGDWVLAGPDGLDLPRPQNLAPGSSSQTLPDFAIPWTTSHQIDPAQPDIGALYVIAEVPPSGRITLEYRPHGDPAQAFWVVRDH